jgi:predicted protein tyrosine phosphatase
MAMDALHRFTVCSLADFPDSVATFRPDAVVAVLDPGDDLPLPPFTGPRIVLRVRDTNRLEPQAPAVVADALAFVASLAPDARVLFHCIAGRSRSPAVALAAAATLVAPDDAVAWVRRVAPGCRPNPWLVQVADRLCGAKGALAQAFPVHLSA